MALGTITKPTASYTRWDHVESTKRVRVRDVQLTSGANYTTGGETITPAAAGFRFRIDSVTPIGVARSSDGSSGIPVEVDSSGANPKIQALRYDGASAGKAFLEEVAANVDLSGYTVRLRMTGV